MLYVLEAMAIKGVFILVPRYVVDNNLLRGVRALESVFLTDTAFSTSSPTIRRRLTQRKKELIDFHHRGLGNSSAR